MFQQVGVYMNPILELKNIHYNYHSALGETPALSDISLTLFKGEFVSIVGPSGCGKSTLLSLIAGLIKTDKGSINFNHADGFVGYMLQHDNLLEWRNIYKNCLLGLEINKKLTKENLEYVDHMLKQYHLEDFKYKKPSELSGGMRQRAALIRTLALKPELLLLDEPFSALDSMTRLTVSEDICKKIRKEGKTTILVTHELAEAISLSDKVYVLSKRPATIKAVFDIHLTKDPDDILGARKAPEFQNYFQKIWEALYGTENL